MKSKTDRVWIVIIIVFVVIVLAAGYVLSDKSRSLIPAKNAEENTSGDSNSTGSGNGSGNNSGGTEGKGLRVISPNGGSIWKRGEQYLVKWDVGKYTNSEITVDLIPSNNVISNPYAVPVSRISGQEMFHATIFPNSALSEGTFTYRVPDTVKPGTYQILIWAGKNCSVANRDAKCAFDLSDGLFTIK